MSVQNPHDRFFRESFGRIEIARNYLEEYLPSDVLNDLDLGVFHLLRNISICHSRGGGNPCFYRSGFLPSQE